MVLSIQHSALPQKYQKQMIKTLRCVGPLSPPEATVLLQHASALFFPSLYEGFGLPPLEAAALGTPLVISQIPPHQEGLSDLHSQEVLWVKPQDQLGWANAFHQVQAGNITPPSLNHQKILLQKWSPMNMAIRMHQIYQNQLK